MEEIGKMEKNSADCEKKQIVKNKEIDGKMEIVKKDREKKRYWKKSGKKSVWKKLRIIGKQYRDSGKKQRKKSGKKIL